MPSHKANPENRKKLLKLIDAYRLTSNDIAGLLDKSVFTVNSWRSVSIVDIPSNELQLLGYKLIDKYGYKEI